MQKGAPAVGVTASGSVLFGVPLPYVTVTPKRLGGGSAAPFEIQAINQPFQQQLTLYTEVNGPTTGTPVGTTEIILLSAAGGNTPTGSGLSASTPPSASPLTLPLGSPVELTVAARRQSGNSPIPPRGAVLAVPNVLAGPLLNSLVNGRSVQLSAQLNGSWQDHRGTVLWQQATQILPAQALLLGAGYLNPLLGSEPAAQRHEHPLVIGLARDQLILAESASPVSLADLASLLQQNLGVTWAASLPAAGRSLSTIPMDLPAGQHHLLALWNTARPSALPSFLAIGAPANRLLSGSSVELTAFAKDARGEPVSLPPGTVEWRLLPGQGGEGSRLMELTPAGDVVVHLGQPGQVLIQASVAGDGPPFVRTWQAEVVSPDALRQLVLRPNAALLEPGQSFLLPSVYGLDEQGRQVWIDPTLLAWSATPSSLASVSPHATASSSYVAAAGPAVSSGWLQVHLTTRPDLAATVPTAVTSGPSPVDTFGAEPPAWRLFTQQATATLAVARRQESASTRTPPRVGNRVLAVTLQSQAGASAPLVYLQAAGARPLVDSSSRALGMWVYGPVPLPPLNVSLWDTAGRRYDVGWTESLSVPLDSPTPRGQPASGSSPGWQYLIAPLPDVEGSRLPLSVGRIGFVHPAENPTTLLLGLLEQWPVSPPASTPQAASPPSPSSPGPPSSAPAEPAPPSAIPPALPASSAKVGDSGLPASTSDSSRPSLVQSWPASGSVVVSPHPRFTVRLPPELAREINPGSVRFFVDEQLAWGRESVTIAGTGAYAPDQGVFWFEPLLPLDNGMHSYRWEAAVRSGSSSTVGAVQVMSRFSVQPIVVPDPGAGIRLAVIGSPGPPPTSLATDSSYEASWRIWDRLLSDYVRSRQPPAGQSGQPKPADLLVVLVPSIASESSSPPSAEQRGVKVAMDTLMGSLQATGMPYLLVAPALASPATAAVVSAPTRLDLGDTRLLILNDWLSRTDTADNTLWDWLAFELRPSAKIRHYCLLALPAFGSLAAPVQQRLRQLLLAAAQGQAKNPSPPTVCYISGEAGSFHAQQDLDGRVLFLNSGGGGQMLRVSPEQGGYYHWLQLTLTSSDTASRWAVYPVLDRLTVLGLPRTLPIGSTITLSAVGDGYAGGQPPLRIPIQYPVACQWRTSDPQRAVIDPRTGKLTARAAGPVTVSLDVGMYRWEAKIEIEAPR